MSRYLSWKQLLAALAVGLAVTLATMDYADARRGGSFGSRGARTFQMPPATRTAPRPPAPVERTMTPRTQAEQPSPAQRQTGPQSQQPGLFGGGRGLIGGLLAGGLIGWLLGSGFGGASGFLTALLQVGIVALGALLLFRLFRGRQEPAYAGAGSGAGYRMPEARERVDLERPLARDAGSMLPSKPGMSEDEADEIGVTQDDLDTFERLLKEVQSAFGREDFSALRQRTTPEIMSYLAEELGQNASDGMRNVVSDVELLQGDVAESWREGDTDYATAALRYSSVDSLQERATGRVVAGDAGQATETTELWTFVRPRGGDWKVAAIQEA